ncbi:MAG TPA: Do family serine endopeptidase [Thermoanaerobaculia bacterium]|nr:Do family serine endopeptidase [Thermoanaerobaculia bacterium]
MSTSQRRQITTFMLVLGAVVFGMVLAGGLNLTVPGRTDTASTLSATQIAGSNAPITSLPSFADLAQAVDPAVVSIQAATIEDRPRGGRGQGGVDPFEFFFGPRGRGQQDDEEDGQGGRGQQPGPGQGQDPEQFRSDAGGSGFVISRDGLVVTNYHVVEGATEVKVHLGDRDYTAAVKGTDQATDIALLKIDAGNDLRYLELGDSDNVRVGDWIMVIGNPLNLDKTVTTGVVSAKGRSIGISDASFENFIQTDAAINFGNSGGPLVNLRGEVVGIATAINWGAENIGFAVPVNTLKEVLPQLREKGKVSRGYLGIQIQNLSYNQARAFGLDSTDGALVGSVESSTPAGKSGIRHGDIIVGVDDIKVKNTHDLINYVANKGPSSTVDLDVLRDGKHMDVKVKLGERPERNAANGQQQEEEEEEGPSGIDWLGIKYQGITDNLRSTHGLSEDVDGVIVTNVAPTSPLYEQFIRPGTIITEVNGQEVHNVADFERLVKGAKSGSYLRLYAMQFSRGQQGQPFFAVVQVP